MARVFDLELLIPPDAIGCEKERIHLEGVTICHNKIFISTNASIGFVFDGPKLLFKKHLGIRKPLKKVEAVDESRVLILTSDGVLSLLDIDSLTIISGKQSQLTNVSDFYINAAPTNGSSVDVEIFIAIQKKKAAALLRLSPSNAMSPIQEYTFSEPPEKAVCHKSAALIQFPTHYKLLDLYSKNLTPLLDVSEKEAPIGVYSDDDSFILSGPGRLGIFISAQSGAPTRPPIQLDSTSHFIVSIARKLCAGGGEFLTVYEEESERESADLIQRQILPIPEIRSLSFSESGRIQVCATKDAVYSLSSLPFYKICFHLLENNKIEEVMSEILKARETSPAMSEDDVNLWTKKILTSAGFVSISAGKFDEAKTFFGQCGIEFEEVIKTLLKFGKIPSKHFGVTDIQPIEEKFAKRVSSENATKYLMLNSVETITKTSCSLICEVFLEMLISQNEANLLSRAIDAVYVSGITISCSFVLPLFQDDEMIFPKAKLLWYSGEHENSLKHLLSLISSSENNEENSKKCETEDFFNFIVSQTSDSAILNIFVSFLDEIIVASPELAFRIIKENHVNDEIVMQKITKSRPLKIRYLEFLVEQKTAKKFVFEELLKEYYKDKNFRAFLQLAENPETWKFVKARKLLELEFGASVDGLLAKCAVFGEAGKIKLAFQSLISGGFFNELEAFAFRRGPAALTELAKYLLEIDSDSAQAADFLGKFGRFIDGKEILNLLPADAPISKYSKLLRAISAASTQKKKNFKTENALLTENLLTIMGDIKDKNVMIERSEENWKNNKCKVSGKKIGDDFYLYPKGYICLPSAAASPFVCPLSGSLLSSFSAAQQSK